MIFASLSCLCSLPAYHNSATKTLEPSLGFHQTIFLHPSPFPYSPTPHPRPSDRSIAARSSPGIRPTAKQAHTMTQLVQTHRIRRTAPSTITGRSILTVQSPLILFTRNDYACTCMHNKSLPSSPPPLLHSSTPPHPQNPPTPQPNTHIPDQSNASSRAQRHQKHCA